MYPTLMASISIGFLVSHQCSALLLPTAGSISNTGNSPSNDPEEVLSNSTTLSYPGEIRCNDQRFGRGLDKRSCWNAWDKMPRSSDQHNLYPRLSGRHTSVPVLSKLPIRYLSDDGLCAIDVRLIAGSKGDTTTDRVIAAAARSVLFECLETDGWGGQLEIPCKSRTLSKGCPLKRKQNLNASYAFAERTIDRQSPET